VGLHLTAQTMTMGFIQRFRKEQIVRQRQVYKIHTTNRVWSAPKWVAEAWRWIAKRLDPFTLPWGRQHGTGAGGIRFRSKFDLRTLALGKYPPRTAG
jgi:hypothetical protein